VSKCTDVRQADIDQRIMERADYDEAKYNLDRKIGNDQYMGVMGKVISAVNKITGDKPLTAKQLQKTINQYVKPNKRESVRLALEIQSRMLANPLIQDQIYDAMIRHTRGFDQNNLETTIEWTDNENGERVPILETIPITALRNIHAEVGMTLNGGRKMYHNNRGVIGTTQYEWGSTKQNLKGDPTGLMYRVNEVTEQFTYNSQSYANQFLYEPQSKSGRKQRDYGFVSITDDVTFFSKYDMKIPEEAGWKLFSEVMEGRTIYNPVNGMIFRYKEEVKMPDGSWQWKNPEPFTYIDGNQEVRLVKFDETQLKEFKELESQARNMFQLIGNEMEQEINYIREQEGKLRKKAKQAGLDEWLTEKIGNLIDDEIEIAGLNAGQMKSGKYYPRMFLQGKIAMALEASMEKQEIAMKQKRQALANPMSDMDTPTRARLANEIIEHEASIINIEEKLNMIFDQNESIDPTTGEFVRTQSWYKNFKSLTRVMDPNEMRTDSDVMMDYTAQVANAVIRNDAILQAGNALLDAKIRGANDNTINASWDIFNSTFYPQNAASQMFGVDLTAKTVSEHLSKVNINVSPEKLVSRLNDLSNMTTFNTLFSPLQGITNYSAMLLKLDRYGRELFIEATNEITDPKKRDRWRRLISASGINTFSEFVDTYFTQSLRPDEIQAHKKEIAEFTRRVKEAEKTNNYNKVIKYKNYVKKLKNKSSKFKRAFQIAAQYAITRNIAFNKNVSNWGKTLGVAGGFAAVLPSINQTEQMLRSQSFIMGALQAVKSGHAKSIESPEAINAGIQATMSLDFGLSHQHVGAALRGPIAGSTINKMKIWHVQKAGFDLRQFKQAVRSMTPDMQLPDGTLNTKAMNAFRLGKSGVKLLAMNPLTIGIMSGATASALGAGMLGIYGAGALGMLGSNRSKQMRKANPFVASFNSTFIRQGMVTLLMDLVISAPGTTLLANSWLKSRFFANPLSKGIAGMSSSMMSLGIGLTQVASALLRGDEEGEIEKLLPKMLFNTPIGIGGSVLFAAGQWAFDTKFAHPEKYNLRNLNYFEDHKRRALQPFIPFGGLGYEAWRKLDIIDRIQNPPLR